MKICLFMLVMLAGAAAAFAFNGYTGYAASPVSYGACAFSCHGPPNSFTPTADGWPSVYEPDSTYTIVMSHGSNTISNFNACVLRQSDDLPAGILQGGSNTATYTHSGEGTAVHGSVNYQTSYTFNWTAPPPGVGTVILYGAVHEGSTNGPNGVCVLTSGESGIEESEKEPVDDFSFNILNSNPVTHVVKMSINVNKMIKVKLVIYDMAGRMAALVLDQLMSPGNDIVTWKPRIGSGVYFVVFSSGTQTEVKKIIVVK